MVYVLLLILLGAAGLYLFALGRGLVIYPDAWEQKRATRLVAMILLVVTVDLSVTWHFFPAPTPFAALGQAIRSSAAEAASYALNKKLIPPFRISETLVMKDIHAVHDHLIYSMEVQVSDSSSYLQMFNAIKKDTMTNGCARPEYRAILRFGVVVEIDTAMPQGYTTVPIILTPADCGF